MLSNSHYLGVEALKAGDYDRAIACFDAALRFDPRNAAAYSFRGLAHVRKGDAVAGLRDFTEAIHLQPGNDSAYAQRGLTYAGRGEDEKAIRDYTEALRIDPRIPRIYILRAASYTRRRENDRAVADCTEALRLDPRNAAAHKARGIAYAEERDYEQAARDFAEALRIDPGYATAYSWFAWLLATCPRDGLRDGERALHYARTAMQLSGLEDSHYLESLAAAYAETGRFAEAVRWQQRALERQEFAEQEAKEAWMRLHLYQEEKPYRELDRPRGPGER
jgi:tetratricopeptide (TPR) repeat protein